MASLLARCGVTLLTLARLCAAPAPTVSIPRGRPPLRPGGSGRSSPPTRGAAHDCSVELEALAGTTLRDYQLLQRLGAAPLLGGGVGFVGANAAVYRARCVAAACDASREYAVKAMFRPADGADSSDVRSGGGLCDGRRAVHRTADSFSAGDSVCGKRSRRGVQGPSHLQ